MTREEYEEKRRRLEAEATDAKEAYLQAKSVYDGVCDELRNLRIDWQEQERKQAPSTDDAGRYPLTMAIRDGGVQHDARWINRGLTIATRCRKQGFAEAGSHLPACRVCKAQATSS